MEHIDHELIKKYFEVRPQLKPPEYSPLFGYEIPAEWEPFVRGLLVAIEQPPNKEIATDAREFHHELYMSGSAAEF